jgi:hypothetical protein
VILHFRITPCNQDLKMPITEMSSRIEQLKNECRTEWNPQGKNIDNGLVDNRGKYELRPRLSWTGLCGKEPWPRERKLWERICIGQNPTARGD